MEEIWKDIKGYEGLYQVSNLGRVKSLPRLMWNGKGYYMSKEKILSLKPSKKGYVKIALWKNREKEYFLVHRLVAEAFIPNPNNLPEVNHIIDDFEHRSDNRVENLEWCTRDYNINYGNRNKRASKTMKGKYLANENSQARKVRCVTTGEIFNTITEAKRKYNSAGYHIPECCRGERKSAGKHPITGEKLVWEYI